MSKKAIAKKDEIKLKNLINIIIIGFVIKMGLTRGLNHNGKW